jgi:hypothetical protein
MQARSSHRPGASHAIQRPRAVHQGSCPWRGQNGTLFALVIDGNGAPAGNPRRIVDDVSSDDPGLPWFDTLPDPRLLLTVDEPLQADAQTPVPALKWIARLRETAARK